MAHSIIMRARVLDPDIDLDVREATFGLDEGWSPFVQGELVCEIPDGKAAAIAAINPHTQERYVSVTITQSYAYYALARDVTREWAGRTLADLTAELAGATVADLTDRWVEWFDPAVTTPPYVRTMRLLIRRRSILHREREVRLRVTSDEMGLHDDAHVNYGPLTPPGAKLHQIVQYVLERAGRRGLDMSTGAANANVNPQLVVWRPGETAWQYLERQVRWAGLQLWATEYGTWRLREAHPTPADLAVVAPGVNMIDLDDVIDRDKDFYTAVLLTYRWADSIGVTHEEVDLDYAVRYPVRVMTETIQDVPFPGYGTATARMTNLLRRARPVTVEAVADWRFTPAQLIQVTTPTGEVLDHAITRIAYNYPADTMTIETRDRG